MTASLPRLSAIGLGAQAHGFGQPRGSGFLPLGKGDRYGEHVALGGGSARCVVRGERK